MKKEALIIFLCDDDPGKLNTRLADEIGAERALLVQKKLLEHTHIITYRLEQDKFVFYPGEITEHDQWNGRVYIKEKQAKEELGERIKLAFSNLFQLGYRKVIMIGSISPDLSEQHIKEAFSRLDNYDPVIGPSMLGGYYLMGMNHYIPELFDEKEWSSGTLLADTIKDTVRLRKTCTFLDELRDIDTAADLAYFGYLESL